MRQVRSSPNYNPQVRYHVTHLAEIAPQALLTDESGRTVTPMTEPDPRCGRRGSFMYSMLREVESISPPIHQSNTGNDSCPFVLWR